MKIKVAPSTIHGIGVFVTEFIAKGEVIEIAPCLTMSSSERTLTAQTTLKRYGYGCGENVAIVWGYGSLYNHSNTPNAVYKWLDYDGPVEFSALRDLKPGEEILTNYNKDPLDQTPIEGLKQC